MLKVKRRNLVWAGDFKVIAILGTYNQWAGKLGSTGICLWIMAVCGQHSRLFYNISGALVPLLDRSVERKREEVMRQRVEGCFKNSKGNSDLVFKDSEGREEEWLAGMTGQESNLA